jgi:hypothetical protein
LTYWTIPFAEPVPIVPQMQEIAFWVKTNVPVSIKVPIAPFGFIYHGPAVQPSDEWQKLSVGDAYERLKAWCAGGGEDADFGQLPGVILAVHTAPGMQAEILVDDVAVAGQEGIGAAVDQQRRRRRFARVTASVVTLPWSDLGRSLETVLDRLDEAAACGSDIVCLPMECVKTDGQPIPGPISTAIAAKAREHGMYVIGNIRETDEGRTLRHVVPVRPRRRTDRQVPQVAQDARRGHGPGRRPAGVRHRLRPRWPCASARTATSPTSTTCTRPRARG